MYNYLKQQINGAQLELNTLNDVAESASPPESSPGTTRRRCSKEKDETHNRTRRLIAAVTALAAGVRSILGEPLKDAACNALSIFNFCDSTEDLERELDGVTKQQKSQQQTFQTVQEQNSENLALLRDDICVPQESVKKIKQRRNFYTYFLFA